MNSTKKKRRYGKIQGTSLIFYSCFVFGGIFLLINGRDLIKYNVSPGPISFIVVGSLLAGVIYLYRYREIYKKQKRAYLK